MAEARNPMEHDSDQTLGIDESTDQSQTIETTRSSKEVCRLAVFGCDSYSSNHRDQHISSEQHNMSLRLAIAAKHFDHECTRDDLELASNLNDDCGTMGEISEKKKRLELHQSFSIEIMNVVARANDQLGFESSRTMVQSDQIHNPILKQYDRGGNNENANLEALSNLNQLALFNVNEKILDPLGEIDQEHSTNDRQLNSGTCLNQFFEKTNSNVIFTGSDYLIWKISGISMILNQSIKFPRGYIYSPSFSSWPAQENFFVRFYPNGNENRISIAIYLCMNYPQRGSFSGTVKFTLVDQSPIGPYHHIAKMYHGDLNEVGASIGSETFTDKNDLHKYGNRFIRNDEIILIIQLRPKDGPRFGQIPACIIDAMKPD